ncbi:hypothetical protein C8R44DRAFT_745658 [Mycena epipterygia]|nr:hypothetical protein C8R44DRAFT_745658 [Mycena epipterygia]
MQHLDAPHHHSYGAHRNTPLTRNKTASPNPGVWGRIEVSQRRTGTTAWREAIPLAHPRRISTRKESRTLTSVSCVRRRGQRPKDADPRARPSGGAASCKAMVLPPYGDANREVVGRRRKGSGAAWVRHCAQHESDGRAVCQGRMVGLRAGTTRETRERTGEDLGETRDLHFHGLGHDAPRDPRGGRKKQVGAEKCFAPRRHWQCMGILRRRGTQYSRDPGRKDTPDQGPRVRGPWVKKDGRLIAVSRVPRGARVVRPCDGDRVGSGYGHGTGRVRHCTQDGSDGKTMGLRAGTRKLAGGAELVGSAPDYDKIMARDGRERETNEGGAMPHRRASVARTGAEAEDGPLGGWCAQDAWWTCTGGPAGDDCKWEDNEGGVMRESGMAHATWRVQRRNGNRCVKACSSTASATEPQQGGASDAEIGGGRTGPGTSTCYVFDAPSPEPPSTTCTELATNALRSLWFTIFTGVRSYTWILVLRVRSVLILAGSCVLPGSFSLYSPGRSA